MHVLNGPTGFGKTRVAAAMIHYYLTQGFKVLFVAKKWRLLDQAAHELTSLFPKYNRTIRRLGGDNEILNHLPSDQRGSVFFTTLQTWQQRKKRNQLPAKLRRAKDLLLIWDECHWAINADLGNELLDYYLKSHTRYRGNNSLAVGLSATPKRHRFDRLKIAYSIPYVALMGRQLAYPIQRNVETGAIWDPIVQNEVVSPESLDQLAANQTRNDQIVSEVFRGRQRNAYTRILIFACNIQHAIVLNGMIAEGGAASRAIHSKMNKRERAIAIQKFRSGEIEVLVNVNQFTEGDNVPEIDAVFIARPTTSHLLLRQMIGRGSRLTADKKHFTIIEFNDQIRQHSESFFHTSDLFDDYAAAAGKASNYRYRGPRQHTNLEHPTFDNLFLPETGNITVARNQTFGVEIELTSRQGVPDQGRRWRQTAQTIIDLLSDCACADVHPSPLGYDQNKNLTRWAVEYDSSAGWEIVSPILQNTEGFHELRRVCQCLSDLVDSHHDLHINYRTGLHVTFGTKLDSQTRVQGFAKRLQRLEPGLMTLVSPSRLFGFNGRNYRLDQRNKYCLSVRESIPNVDLVEFWQLANDRYRTVNLSQADAEVQTVEVRMHNGTTDFRKIAIWISLWMLILNRAQQEWLGKGVYGPVFPGANVHVNDPSGEDIFQLLAEDRINLSHDLSTALHKRRCELRSAWAQVLPKRVESWASHNWYQEESTERYFSGATI